MNSRYCYWTVVDGDYTPMAETVVQSAHQAGVRTDFHVWADRPIKGAMNHPAGNFDQWKWGCLFKLHFLRDKVKHLRYDYFVWFDADTYFVRNPGNVLSVMNGSPLHIALESDLCPENNQRREWWGCPNETFVELMRSKGVQAGQVFNVNGGLFVVHRDAIELVFKLAFDFFDFCQSQGFTFVDEPLLAYAMQMICGDVSQHTLRANTGLWASDWTGCFADQLPDGKPWTFVDYFTFEEFAVNPAIIHAMRSKAPLIEASRSSRQLSAHMPS